MKHSFKKSFMFILTLLALTFSALGVTPVSAAITVTDGMAASLVLGQANFTSGGAGGGATGMTTPSGVAVDPATGKVFVGDRNNNRVLRFASAATLTNGAAAEAVLGQPNFSTTTAGWSQSTMYNPMGVAVDSAGRLWVADSNNARVLRFDNASSLASGANANAVLGQTDFVARTSGTAQNKLWSPSSVAVDSAGRLWVADVSNSRVLRFDNAASKANGANADGVLGKSDFVTNSCTWTATTMCSPYGVYMSSTGTLWVADGENYRILRFDNAAAKANGATADGVLGQPDFIARDPSVTSQNRMSQARGLAFDDSTGTLYVMNGDANRILVFNNAAAKANGANADNVIGQTNFTSNSSGNSATTQSMPWGGFFDPAQKVLWVTSWNNNRVLMYGTIDTPPTVNSFTATTPSSSLDIPINAFTASDNNAVTGYLITESSTAPLAGAAGWTGTAPAIYTVANNGPYTLYPWAKDAADNVSAVYGSPASVSVPPAPAMSTGSFPLYVAKAEAATVVTLNTSGTEAAFASGLTYPLGIAFDTSGNLYAANGGGGAKPVHKMTSAGSVSVFANINNNQGLAFSPAGDLYVSEPNDNDIKKITPGGAVSTFVSSGLNSPTGLAFDSIGNLYVGDMGTNTIKKVTPGSVVSTYASVNSPYSLAFDASGNLFVGALGNGVWKVTPAGTVTQFAAGFAQARGLAFDISGNLYVADYNAGNVKKVTPGGVVSVFASVTNPTYVAFAFCSGSSITVMNNNDAGAGSLRQALNDICADGTITFDSGLSGGTIRLASTLTLDKNVTIDGSSLASQVSISGDTNDDTNGDLRVFLINSAIDVTLNNLTIKDGYAGVGVESGAGIHNSGNLTINDSTFTNNVASYDGGAIVSNFGTLTITNSAFTGNRSGRKGGAVIVYANTTSIANSTFYGNSSGEDGTITVNNSGTLWLRNNTIAGNSGGAGRAASLYEWGGTPTTNMVNNIIADKTGGSIECGLAHIGTNTNNIIEDGSCSAPISGDPKLDVAGLASNGGPTQTITLGTGSTAIDAGHDATCAAAPVSGKDQRGTARPQGAHCDIGAYEVTDLTAPETSIDSQPSDPNNDNTPTFTFSGDDGAGSGVASFMCKVDSGSSYATCASPFTSAVLADGAHTFYVYAIDNATNADATPASYSWIVDTTAPSVSSIVRAGASSTISTASADFTVTFSESVTGVDTSDFALTVTGVTGASVSTVNGTGSTRTVTVNTGSGNGTIRLDIPNTASITDLAGNSLASLPFTSGDIYTIVKTPAAPGAAMLTAPVGSIGANYNPTYTWNVTPTATYYHLYVAGPSGVVLDQWFQAVNICNTTICTVASPTLGGGAYAWYVQTWNSVGFGPWSNNAQPTNFSTTIPTVPAGAVLTTPIGNIGTNYNPTYTWNKITNATWYRLYVSGPSGVVLDQWYQATNVCNTTTCSVASPTLGGGAHAWFVQTWNPAGYGPWSNNAQPMNFSTTIPPVPAAATLTAPIGNIGTNYNPTYTWNKVADATWYRLYVSGPGGVLLDQWYQATSICDATICSVASPMLGGGAHVWFVQTWNPTGFGPWSNNAQPTNFSTTVPTVPAGAVLTAPSGTIASHTPTYQWNKVDMAAWYHLYVSGPNGVVKDQWYSAASVCNATTCSVVSPTLQSGDHTWWIQTYNAAGYGSWVSAAFKVNP